MENKTNFTKSKAVQEKKILKKLEFTLAKCLFPRPLRERARVRGHIFACSFSQKYAFTLAEVLITLAIIGVVAAMTMPVLINKYQEIVTVTKVKKFYSTMSQALQLSFIDHGYPEDWDGTSSGIYEKIIPHLKTLDSCCESCTPKKSCDKIPKIPASISMLNGVNWDSNYYNTDRIYPKLILADGSYIWFRGAKDSSRYNCDNDTNIQIENSTYGPGNVCGVFWFDVNGFDKTPNQLGKDIFVAYLTRHALSPFSGDDCYLNGAGWACSAWILKHGNMKYPDKKEE